MLDTVIFDMDGVICHTNPYHSKAFRAFFAKRNMYPAEAEFAEHMYGKNNSYIFSHFMGRSVTGEELQQFENEKEGLFREIYKPHIEAIHGFVAFAEQLLEQGYKLGVATSAPRANMDLIIDSLGIRHVFDSMLGSEDVSRHKPDPMVYLKSCTNLGASPETCLVFEDSYSGITAAQSAGMKVIGVLSSHGRDELPSCSYYIDQYDTTLLSKVSSL